MMPDLAATVALQALGFLAGSEEALQRFMDLTGADRDMLRDRAEEPEFLASILDFLLTNEELLIDFCDEASIDVRSVHMARHVLAGGT